MAVDGYFPKITPPKNYDNYRMGDGLGMIITLADGKKSHICTTVSRAVNLPMH